MEPSHTPLHGLTPQRSQPPDRASQRSSPRPPQLWPVVSRLQSRGATSAHVRLEPRSGWSGSRAGLDAGSTAFPTRRRPRQPANHACSLSGSVRTARASSTRAFSICPALAASMPRFSVESAIALPSGMRSTDPSKSAARRGCAWLPQSGSQTPSRLAISQSITIRAGNRLPCLGESCYNPSRSCQCRQSSRICRRGARLLCPERMIDT